MSEKRKQRIERLYAEGKYGKYREEKFKNGDYYDVVSYVTNFDKGFDKAPFTDGDSLVLCQLAYTNIHLFAGKKLREIPSLIKDEKEVAPYCGEDCMRLIKAMEKSVRFGDIVVLDGETKVSEEEQCQYGVLLFDCGDFLYTACRGTDDHLIGWFEDIDLIYKEELVSHRYTVNALNRYGATYDKPFIVGGHSKGGNIAVYASAFCNPEISERIIAVYDHDGPGFLPSVAEREEMRKIFPKVDKTCPELSVFGIMMREKELTLRTVYSHNNGIYQHYIMNWQIEKNDGTLVLAEKNNRASRVVNGVVDEVLPKMTYDDRVCFRTFCVSIMGKANIASLDDISFLAVLKVVGAMFSEPIKRQGYMWKLLGMVIASVFRNEKRVRREIRREKNSNR